MSAAFRLTDSTLRDGSHALAHQFTEAQVRAMLRVALRLQSSLDGQPPSVPSEG